MSFVKAVEYQQSGDGTMEEKQSQVNRRIFLRTVGAAGLGTVLAGCKGKEEAGSETSESESPTTTKQDKGTQMPKRTLGKTGVEVPVLSLGTMFNLLDNQIILRNTLKYGVDYWDTSNVYAGGNSELGIGQFLSRNPEVRENLFLVSKALRASTQEGMEERLQLSLTRMKTEYLDLHYFHAMEDPAQLTDEIRTWAEGAKKRGLIRYFGFTAHKNMVKCLNAGAKLDWIDVIMMPYNFRVMQDPEMHAAIDACHKANIGLVAMKTTGKTTIKRFKQPIETEADKKMIEHFVARGYSPEQACIKFTLDDERIASACVQMDSTAVLDANVAAVLDKTKLAQADKDVLSEYARATCSAYCAGCAAICDSAVPEAPYVSDIMRYLMYHNSYGDTDRANTLFAQIPRDARDRLLDIDYGPAEARCPQHVPIGELMAEAVCKLA
jgi:predicted aldo/keto reductase-like oxidoreductase